MKKIFTLFLAALAANSMFAAWTGSGQGVEHNGTWYALYETAESNFSTISSKEYALSAPGNQLTFDAECVPIKVLVEYWGGNLNVAESSNNGSSYGSAIFSQTPPKNSYQSYGPLSLNLATNKIKFYTETGATGKKYFKNIFITMASYLEDPSKSALDFGSERAAAGAKDTLSFSIAWCNVAAELTLSGANTDKFEVLPFDTAKLGHYATSTIAVVYDRSEEGDHSATLTFGTKTVSITGRSTGKEVPELSATNIVLPADTWNATFNLADYVTTTSDGEITVGESSDSDIATYAEGVFTALHKNGTANFLVSVPETDNFAPLSTTLSVTVAQETYSYVAARLDEAETATDGVRFPAADEALAASHNREEAIAALNTYRSAAIEYTSMFPANMSLTFLLENPTFDAFEAVVDWDFGWTGTNDETKSGEGSTSMTAYQRQSGNSNFSGNFAQMWCNAGSIFSSRQLNAGECKQPVVLDPGAYKLQANTRATNMTLTLFAGESSADASNGQSSLNFLVQERDTIWLGVRHEAVNNANEKWVAVDNFELIYIGTGVPTVVDAVESAADQQKFFLDGRIVIRRADDIFDVLGRRVR